MTSTELITSGSEKKECTYKTRAEYLVGDKITPETKNWTMIYLNKFHINVPESELDSVPEWNASQFTWGCNVKANKKADPTTSFVIFLKPFLKKEGTYKTLDEYLASMKKQNEELRNKNGTVEPDKEFMADLEWIRINSIFYSFDGNFNNLRDI
jgi:hypothetical protein